MRNFRISFLPPGEKERISITMRASCEEALKKFFTDDMVATFETLTEVEKLKAEKKQLLEVLQDISDTLAFGDVPHVYQIDNLIDKLK